jgi:hypothetical protein
MACHVIQQTLNPQLMSHMASYDVANYICQALPAWPERGAGGLPVTMGLTQRFETVSNT